jgi:hypothetical protein
MGKTGVIYITLILKAKKGPRYSEETIVEIDQGL